MNADTGEGGADFAIVANTRVISFRARRVAGVNMPA
jgi:hypothetical protein